MQVIRPVGREAAARKYDLLSALMAHGLAGDKHCQRLVLRLMALITTRYNWQRDELTMGQREIARLWCVDERTVKRDMARLRSLGWLDVKRHGARGRVTVYGLGIERILLDTRLAWPNIGPDFCERLDRTGGSDTPPADSNVVPLHRMPVAAAGDLWAQARARLAAEDPALFDAWIAGLADGGIADGVLTLIAPTRFHATYLRTHLAQRLDMAVRRADPTIRQVRLDVAT